MKAFYAMKQTDYDPEMGSSAPLYVNNFGFYRNSPEEIRVFRPSGRRDYHLVYVSSGEMEANGKRIGSGEAYLFFPNRPQCYVYRVTEGSLYYWIHFTGADIAEILSRGGISGDGAVGNGRRTELDALFRLLTDSVSIRGEAHTPYSAALLRSMLELIALPAPRRYPFSRARRALEDLSSTVQVRELAATYNMSTAHFIRSFKEAYGTTPTNYRILCQIMQAKNLLSDTELSIGAIAEQCGFSDAFYFSRIFKKHAGLSPSLYRRQTRTE